MSADYLLVRSWVAKYASKSFNSILVKIETATVKMCNSRQIVYTNNYEKTDSTYICLNCFIIHKKCRTLCKMSEILDLCLEEKPQVAVSFLLQWFPDVQKPNMQRSDDKEAENIGCVSL